MRDIVVHTSPEEFGLTLENYTTRKMLAYVFQHPKFTSAYDEFNDCVRGATDILVTDFNRKKRAFEVGTSTRKKTGDLDIAKLPRYRVDDDIFKRRTMLAKGKNHSFEMLLDWSGSFSASISESIRQAIILGDFSRQIRAPFAISAFISGDRSTPAVEPGEVVKPRTLLKHILHQFLHDKMTSAEYEFNRKFLWYLATKFEGNWRSPWANYDRWSRKLSFFGGDDLGFTNEALREKVRVSFEGLDMRFTLNCTPLNSALVAVREKMRRAAKPNLVQNLIILTDGASDQLSVFYASSESIVVSPKFEFLDPVSKKIYTWTQDDTNELGMEPKGSGWHSPAATHLILKTFDWGEINKVMFFIEPKSRRDTLHAFRYLAGDLNKENLLAARMHYGWKRPLDVARFGKVDHLILVDPNSFREKEVDEDIDTSRSAKAIAAQFARNAKYAKYLQVISRRLAAIVTAQFALNTSFLRDDQDFCYTSWEKVTTGSFRSSALDKFLEEERRELEFEMEQEEDEEMEEEDYE